MDAGRIDYVKLYWQRDAAITEDGGEERIMALARTTLGANGEGRPTFNFSVVGGKTGRDANMVMELWGKAADEFAKAMPPSWWGYVRRLDFRRELPQRSDVEMRAFALEQ